jgi:hypothetical protein
MIEINLVPDVKQELIKAQRVRSAVISVSISIGVIAVVIVTLLAIYVFGVQTVRSTLDDNAINDGSAKLSKVQDLSKTLTIQNQLTKISALNSQKKIDSRVFDMLQAISPPAPNTITVSTLSLDSTTDTLTIDGQAADYTAVEVFKKTIDGANVSFKNDQGNQTVPLASSVSISNTSWGEDSSGAKVLRFTLSFVYAQELFSPSSIGAAVTVKANGDAADSNLGLPSSIIADRATDLGGN